MKLHSLAVLAALLVATGALVRAQEKPDAEPPIVQKTREQLGEMRKTLEAMRGAKFKSDVAVKYQSEEGFRAFLKADIDKDMPEARARSYGRALGALGLFPKGFDIRKEVVDMMAGQAAAYYDPKQATFFVVKADMPEAMAMPAMFHELDHGLQDQRFDLKKFYEGLEKADDDDLVAARRFVVEGEATYLMTQYSLKPMGMEAQIGQVLESQAQLSREQMSQAMKQQAAMLGDKGKKLITAQEQSDKLPAFLYHSLVDPYYQGAFMISKVKEKGGWKAVDDLFAHPPTSTHQCLHPKSLTGERQEPVKIALPDETATLGEGWKKGLENTLGELGVRSVLEEHGMTEGADSIAKGVRGDRLCSYEKGDDTAVVWLSSWSSATSAKKFIEASHKMVGENDEHGGWSVAQKGRTVAVVVIEGSHVLPATTKAAAQLALEKATLTGAASDEKPEKTDKKSDEKKSDDKKADDKKSGE